MPPGYSICALLVVELSGTPKYIVWPYFGLSIDIHIASIPESGSLASMEIVRVSPTATLELDRLTDISTGHSVSIARTVTLFSSIKDNVKITILLNMCFFIG